MSISASSEQQATCSILEVHNLQVRFVPQRVDFGPIHRNTAPDLNETELVRKLFDVGNAASCLFFDEEYLFCLVKIGNMSILVYTPAEVPCTCTIPRPATYEA